MPDGGLWSGAGAGGWLAGSSPPRARISVITTGQARATTTRVAAFAVSRHAGGQSSAARSLSTALAVVVVSSPAPPTCVLLALLALALGDATLPIVLALLGAALFHPA